MGRAAKVQSFFESAMTDFTEQLHGICPVIFLHLLKNVKMSEILWWKVISRRTLAFFTAGGKISTTSLVTASLKQCIRKHWK